MSPPSATLLLLLAVAAALIGGVGLAGAVPATELDTMVAALRDRGYHLLANAIMTSDLRLRLLDAAAFTMFAPTDSAVFSLDMASASSADYYRSLLFHVAPVKFTLAALRTLPASASFPSLLDDAVHRLHRHGPAYHSVVSVDGVALVDPGVFYGPHVAVHGLEGILDVRQASSPANTGAVHAPVSSVSSWISPAVSSPDRAPVSSPASFAERLDDDSTAGFSEKRFDEAGEIGSSPSPYSAGFSEKRLDYDGEIWRSPSPSPAGLAEKRLDDASEISRSPSQAGFQEKRLDDAGEIWRSPSPSPSPAGFAEKRLDDAGEISRAPSSVGFSEKRLDDASEIWRSPSPSPVGFWKKHLDDEGKPTSRSPPPRSSVGDEAFLPGFNCAASSGEGCTDGGGIHGVVDDDGSVRSEAVAGLHEHDARLFLSPFVLAAPPSMDECAAAVGETADGDAKSIFSSAKCRVASSKGMGQDDASDANIGSHISLAAGHSSRQGDSDDLL